MQVEQQLAKLYEKLFAAPPSRIEALRAHASARRIYRLHGPQRSAIGIANADRAENRAFVEFSLHFKRCALPVPHIYAYDEAQEIYIEEDLGDVTLFDRLAAARDSGEAFPQSIEQFYRRALSELLRFQIVAGQNLDYNFCHQGSIFDRQAMLDDMCFFTEQFVRYTGIRFDEAALRRDFDNFATHLSAAPARYFLYRDFQSRNIMVRDDRLYFIDYQAGRRGALQYDVASLLFQAQARIPHAARERLLEYYLAQLAPYGVCRREEFLRYYDDFVYLRAMQVLGTYGLRGLKEGKSYFIESIAFVKENLGYLLATRPPTVAMPFLTDVLQEIVTHRGRGALKT